jgi:DNA-binding response OmpR family regulator
MDLGMPNLNGFDAARRIREEPWGLDIVLIATTGWGQEEDRRRTKEAGFDHHLVKPVDPDDLRKLLDGLVACRLDVSPEGNRRSSALSPVAEITCNHARKIATEPLPPEPQEAAVPS